ncbi:hypothetical protein LCGC14_0195790 [marine sediment metagenome]|uniref:Uncharacterized protein n=1 Tax=marine sediment metagenome TaxID=412755 RepID=A0A0F9X4H2_9ZZZZ
MYKHDLTLAQLELFVSYIYDVRVREDVKKKWVDLLKWRK